MQGQPDRDHKRDGDDDHCAVRAVLYSNPDKTDQARKSPADPAIPSMYHWRLDRFHPSNRRREAGIVYGTGLGLIIPGFSLGAKEPPGDQQHPSLGSDREPEILGGDEDHSGEGRPDHLAH